MYDANKNSCSELSEYIARTVANASEFISAMNPEDLGFAPIIEPADPVTGATDVTYEK